MITLPVYGNEVPLRLEKLLQILFTLRGQIKSGLKQTKKIALLPLLANPG